MTGGGWDQALFGRDGVLGAALHPEPLPDPLFDEIEHEAPIEESAAVAEAVVPAELQAYARGMTSPRRSRPLGPSRAGCRSIATASP